MRTTNFNKNSTFTLLFKHISKNHLIVSLLYYFYSSILIEESKPSWEIGDSPRSKGTGGPKCSGLFR
jgi:hypothetical protein